MCAGTTSRYRLLLADCAAPMQQEALPLSPADVAGLAWLRRTLVHSAAASVYDDIRGGGVQPHSLRRRAIGLYEAALPCISSVHSLWTLCGLSQVWTRIGAKGWAVSLRMTRRRYEVISTLISLGTQAMLAINPTPFRPAAYRYSPLYLRVYSSQG